MLKQLFLGLGTPRTNDGLLLKNETGDFLFILTTNAGNSKLSVNIRLSFWRWSITELMNKLQLASTLVISFSSAHF